MKKQITRVMGGFLLSSILSLPAIAQVGNSQQEAGLGIRNGSSVKKFSDAPFMARIYTRQTADQDFSPSCGAVFIAPNYLMTSAYCVTDGQKQSTNDPVYPANNIKIEYGAVDFSNGGVTSARVKNIWRYPFYTPKNHMLGDIAIIQVTGTTDSVVKPVKLIPKQYAVAALYPGNIITTYGWGLDTRGGKPAKILQMANIPVGNIDAISALMDIEKIPPSFYDPDNMFGAVSPNAQAISTGDEGGPAIINYAGDTWLVGIAGWGPGDSMLSFFTALKNPGVLDWVGSITNLNASKSVSD